MLEDLWNLIRMVCGPFIFAVKALAACWRGFWFISSKVFSVIGNLAAPGLALWNSSRAVVSPTSEDHVNVDILHNLQDAEGHMQTKAQQFTMPVEEFANWDFSGMSSETQQFGNAIQQILNDGDSVSIRYEK